MNREQAFLLSEERTRREEAIAGWKWPGDKQETEHDAGCSWPQSDPCLRFSTDGTRLGAEIAHVMGTTSELEITRMAKSDTRSAIFSDVEEEQADWDEE